ncbi:TIGR02300 family protein [Phreatobacter aquaticus]|uniref:TIGR02300 family protein n=1 Tax=Phreatobacter aquaticus TaxID=2570229 RepID=A0A4D7QEC9_9HYPH|nr:TIGR02300 family protein [Phreatobacter aquaticus]QCK84881.1 TIGR02300 family protein [Phreatobacter aquaticus]
MARPELGVKRIDPTTGKKFYDLNRDPIVSPYTGEVLPRAIFEPVRRGSAAAAAKAAPVVADEEVELEVPDAELISLEEADDEATGAAKVVVVDDDIEVEDDAADDADTFLEEDEDDAGDDVTDLIGDAIETDDEV